MISENIPDKRCRNCKYKSITSNEYPCQHCTHMASDMWESLDIPESREDMLKEYVEYDTGINDLLSEMEEHYVGKCKKCSARKPECGIELSISGYHNCLELGLFIEKKD